MPTIEELRATFGTTEVEEKTKFKAVTFNATIVDISVEYFVSQKGKSLQRIVIKYKTKTGGIRVKKSVSFSNEAKYLMSHANLTTGKTYEITTGEQGGYSYWKICEEVANTLDKETIVTICEPAPNSFVAQVNNNDVVRHKFIEFMMDTTKSEAQLYNRCATYDYVMGRGAAMTALQAEGLSYTYISKKL